MPVHVPHFQVVIHRDGKNIRVPIGKPFEFTAAEAKEIHSLHPQALRPAIVEALPAPEPVAEVTSEVEETRPAAKKPPRKPAPVEADDDEL